MKWLRFLLCDALVDPLDEVRGGISRALCHRVAKTPDRRKIDVGDVLIGLKGKGEV